MGGKGEGQLLVLRHSRANPSTLPDVNFAKEFGPLPQRPGFCAASGSGRVRWSHAYRTSQLRVSE